MKYNFKDIRKTQKGRGFYLRISNEIASYIIYKTQKFNILPNHITLLSLVCGFLFFFSVISSHLIISAIFVNLLYLFDNMDGQLARVKKMSSSFGAFLDSLIDGWNITLIIAGIGFYSYYQELNILYLYLTLVFFILSFLDFALSANVLKEFSKNGIDTTDEDGSLQKRYKKLKLLIKIVDSTTLYDKWILVITISLLTNTVWISLYYVVYVRLLNYSTKLFKIYLQFR